MNDKSVLIVFDLDGTLSRSDRFSVNAIQDVQRELGFKVSSESEIKNCFGMNLNDLMNSLFKRCDKIIIDEYKKWIALTEKRYLHLAETYPGITEMLNDIKSKGYRTAVCSNSSNKYIITILRTLNLIGKIDYIQELEPHMKDKSESLRNLILNVSPMEAIMIGDTSFDKSAAEINNLPFIGCKYGYRPHEMENLRYVAENPIEIPPLIEKILYFKENVEGD